MQTDVRMPPAYLIRVYFSCLMLLPNWRVQLKHIIHEYEIYISKHTFEMMLSIMLAHSAEKKWCHLVKVWHRIWLMVCECNEVCARNRKNALHSLNFGHLLAVGCISKMKIHDLPFHSISSLFLLRFSLFTPYHLPQIFHVSGSLSFFFTCCAIYQFPMFKFTVFMKLPKSRKEHIFVFTLAKSQHVCLCVWCSKQKCNVYSPIQIHCVSVRSRIVHMLLKMRNVVVCYVCAQSVKYWHVKANGNSFWLTRQFHKQEMLNK